MFDYFSIAMTVLETKPCFFLLRKLESPKQTLNSVSVHLKAFLSRFNDEIIIPNTMTDILKSEKIA